MEKSKVGSRVKRTGGQLTELNRMLRAGFIEKGRSKQRPEEVRTGVEQRSGGRGSRDQRPFGKHVDVIREHEAAGRPSHEAGRTQRRRVKENAGPHEPL